MKTKEEVKVLKDKFHELTDEQLEKVIGGETIDYWTFVVYTNDATGVVIAKKISTNEVKTFTIDEFEVLSENDQSWMW